MRKPLLALLLLPLLTLGAVAAAFTFTGSPTNFTDCSASGSSATTLVANRTYFVTVTTETVWLCLASAAATCGSGGMMIPTNTAFRLTLKADQVSVACRSTSSAGDLQLTPID